MLEMKEVIRKEGLTVLKEAHLEKKPSQKQGQEQAISTKGQTKILRFLPEQTKSRHREEENENAWEFQALGYLTPDGILHLQWLKVSCHMTKLPRSLQGPMWTRNQLMNIYGGPTKKQSVLGKSTASNLTTGFKNVIKIQLQKKVYYKQYHYEHEVQE